MSISSMTAYGFGESVTSSIRYSCEIKSLNSRFLEVNVRMPRSVLALESELIALVKSKLARGKVDVFIDIQTESDTSQLPALSPVALQHYLNLAQQVQQAQKDAGLFGSGSEVNASQLMRFEGVLETKSAAKNRLEIAEGHREGITGALNDALDQLKSMRAAEGDRLKQALASMVEEISEKRQVVAKGVEEIRSHVHGQYRKRIETLWQQLRDGGLKVGELPEDRLAFEITVLADKSDIEEEITRLQSHEQEFMEQLANSKPVGRRLDFLCQEMHREVNTMSNKAVQTSVSKQTMAMKEIVERLRQQVQNIE